MKTSFAVLALLGYVNAAETVHISIDQNELARAAQAIAGTAEEYVNDNMDNIQPIALSAQGIVEEFMTRSSAFDDIKADAILNFLGYAKDAFYPNPATCDEVAFADCLVGRARY